MVLLNYYCFKLMNCQSLLKGCFQIVVNEPFANTEKLYALPELFLLFCPPNVLKQISITKTKSCTPKTIHSQLQWNTKVSCVPFLKSHIQVSLFKLNLYQLSCMAVFHSARRTLMHVGERWQWGKKYKLNKRMMELKLN